MWRSVPQMPVLRTRMRTSLIPTSGSGTSSSHSPSRAWDLTRACTRPPSRGSAALLDGGVVALAGADVQLARAGDLLLGILEHLDPLRQPARRAGNREH